MPRDFQIMEVYKVAPFDQNLCLQGKYLVDTTSTLGQLKVLPKSLIYLRADEPAPGVVDLMDDADDGWVGQHPEEGFKGACLSLTFGFCTWAILSTSYSD